MTPGTRAALELIVLTVVGVPLLVLCLYVAAEITVGMPGVP